MERVQKLGKGISRQFSGSLTGSLRKTASFGFMRQSSLDPRRVLTGEKQRFTLGRQSSLDPGRREDDVGDKRELVWTLPSKLDATIQLLYAASRGDVHGVEELLRKGADVDEGDFDGRTALHIAACEGHLNVVKCLLKWKANVNTKDRWGSTPIADAKHYGHGDVFNTLRSRGATVPMSSTMAVSNSKDVPEYELNPRDFIFGTKSYRHDKYTYQVATWNGIQVLVKMLDSESHCNPDDINGFKHELALQTKVRHPNLVQFVGAVTQEFPMMIVFEHHQKGDLASYLQKKRDKKGRLPADYVLMRALEIARGMNYLHEMKPDPILHCNLTPRSIMMDDIGQLKVSEFGCRMLTRVSQESFKFTSPPSRAVDNLYSAPEVYKKEEFDQSIDVFSFALILYEMIEGLPAFHPKSREEAAKLICLDGARPLFTGKPKHYPPGLVELIMQCWDQRPSHRPTFSEVIDSLNEIGRNCPRPSSWKQKLPWRKNRE